MPDALKRKERQECWKARDEYYGCMETNLVPYLLINQEKKVLEAQGTFLFTFLIKFREMFRVLYVRLNSLILLVKYH